MGANRLLDDLRANRYFKDRELVPLCLSHEGYKQPQQLLVLAYFLSIGQPFDLVVNIDGFNEVALSSLNDQRGLDISMPSVMHLDPLVNLVNQATLTPEKLQSLAAISQYKERINYLVARLQRNRFAAINFVLERLHRSATAGYQTELARFGNLPSAPSNGSLILATPSVSGSRRGASLRGRRAQLDRRLDARCRRCSRLEVFRTFTCCSQTSTSQRERFSPDEAKIARSDASPFKKSAEAGYPVLVARVGRS